MIIVIPVAVFAVILGFVVVYHAAKAKGYAEGAANAQIDPATRLVTRGVADQILAMEFAAAERGRPFTIVLFSIDNFRRLAAFDSGAGATKILLGSGAILRRRTRGMNISARFDDQGSFISILGGVEAEGAHIFARRVQKDFATMRIGGQAVSLSATVCEYRAGMHSIEELLASGERAEQGQTDVVFYR
jgi:GGDEF domain-containing protein